MKYPSPRDYNFCCSFRVRFHQCDPHGIVHHSNYIRYLEDARMEYWRLSGTNYKQFEDSGFSFFVADSFCKYLGSATYDDDLEIYARVLKISRISLVMDYVLTQKGDEELIIYAKTTLVCIDSSTRRPARIPDYVIKGINEFEDSDRKIKCSVEGI